jgi:hypothetical protein
MGVAVMTDRDPISLRTAPCGNQEPHRAHTYGDRGHTCLGLTKGTTCQLDEDGRCVTQWHRHAEDDACKEHDMDERPGKTIELKRARRPDEGHSYELHFTSAAGNGTNIERLTRADLDTLRKVVNGPRPATADAMHREGDHLVARLSPDAYLVTDAATCIVLVTPERRITVSNVDDWREQLFTARTWAGVYRDEAETRHRDENQAARQMKEDHCARMREPAELIEHLNRSPDHGTNEAGELIRLQAMSKTDLIKLHQRKHGLR